MRDNARRFRFNQLLSRYNQYRELWGRKMREREEGPLDFRRRKAALNEPHPPPPPPAPPPPPGKAPPGRPLLGEGEPGAERGGKKKTVKQKGEGANKTGETP